MCIAVSDWAVIAFCTTVSFYFAFKFGRSLYVEATKSKVKIETDRKRKG